MPTPLQARTLSLLALLAVCCSAGSSAETGEARWRTAFVKRGFVGVFQEAWLGGPGSVVRSRTPIPFAGTGVRVLVTGAHATEVVLERLALVRGADDAGAIVGQPQPILFAGKPSLTLAGAVEKWSDDTAMPMERGTWYVQDSYLSASMPYAYDVDAGSCSPRGSDGEIRLAKPLTATRVGVTTRIDVLTTDTRPGIVCYGDSITHGYSSTPNGGMRYPDQLAALLNRPTLNLGVNGDVIQYAGGAPLLIKTLQGVDTVVFLLGINDLIGGSLARAEDYAAKATAVISGVRALGLKIYIGTVPPAAGYKDYDKRMPEIETLRQGINAWIRTASGATGVIDFDRSLADPEHPERMRAPLQSDWLHPSDAGYRLMAETAAAVIAR